MDETTYEIEFNCDTNEGIENLKYFILNNRSDDILIKGFNHNQIIEFIIHNFSNDKILPLYIKWHDINLRKSKYTINYTNIFTHMYYFLKYGKADILQQMYNSMRLKGIINLVMELIEYDALDDETKQFYDYFFKKDNIFESDREYDLPEYMTPIHLASKRLSKSWMIKLINDKDTFDDNDKNDILHFIENNPEIDTEFFTFLIESKKMNELNMWANTFYLIINLDRWDIFELILSHKPINDIIETDDDWLDLIGYALDPYKCDSQKIWRWLVENINYSHFENYVELHKCGNASLYINSMLNESKIYELLYMIAVRSDDPLNFFLELGASFRLKKERFIELIQTYPDCCINYDRISREIYEVKYKDIYDILCEYGLFDLQKVKLDRLSYYSPNLDIILDLIKTTDVTLNYDFIMPAFYHHPSCEFLNEFWTSMREYRSDIVDEFITEYGVRIIHYLNHDVDRNINIITMLIHNGVNAYECIMSDHNKNINIYIYDVPIIYKSFFHRKNEETFHKLIELKNSIGFDLSKPNRYKCNALYFSVFTDDFNLMKYLIENEEMNYYVETNDGLNLIDIAITRMCSPNIISYLLDVIGLIPKQSLETCSAFSVNSVISPRNIIENMKYIHSRQVVDLHSYCQLNMCILNIYNLVKFDF